MPTARKFATMDEYLAAATPVQRAALEEIRRVVLAVVPDAVPTIAYQMPAFRKGRVFVYVGAFAHHVGIYPPVRGDDALEAELAPYRGPKGNLKFASDRPLPLDLVRRVVVALARQYATPLR